MLTDNQKKILKLIDETRLGDITYWEEVIIVQSMRKMMWDQNFGDIIRKILDDFEEIERERHGLTYCANSLYLKLIEVYGVSGRDYFHRDLADEKRKKLYKKRLTASNLILVFILLILLILLCVYVIFPMFSFK